jgi:hypothetical protein
VVIAPDRTRCAHPPGRPVSRRTPWALAGTAPPGRPP